MVVASTLVRTLSAVTSTSPILRLVKVQLAL